MPLYEITVHRKSADYVTMYEEKNNPKAAYEYGKSKGLEIFGEEPDSVRVKQEKPV